MQFVSPQAKIVLALDAFVFDKTLTSRARKRLSKSDFAIPESRKYPIHDKSHARNALSRVAQHGTPEQKKRVRAAVHRKYPDMGKSDD
jgi:hypothetical protein